MDQPMAFHFLLLPLLLAGAAAERARPLDAQLMDRGVQQQAEKFAQAALLLRAAANTRKLRRNDAKILRAAQSSVEDLGCWGEGYPNSLQPLGKLSAGWRTVSPVVCGCLCRTRWGSSWNGLVGFGYQHKSTTCSCGVHPSTANAGVPFTYEARGRMEDKCCPPYDADLGIIGFSSSEQISCPCPVGDVECDRKRNVVTDPVLKRALEGRSSENWWSNKVFRVKLGDMCSLDTCPRPLPTSDSKWAEFGNCPARTAQADDGQQCILEKGATPRDVEIRVGGRTPTKTGMLDSFVEGTMHLTAEEGVACDASLALKIAGTGGHPLSMMMAMKRTHELRWNAERTAAWAHPFGFTKAQSAAQIASSLEFICTHPNLVELDTLTCWRRRGANEAVGGVDCTPSPEAQHHSYSPSRTLVNQFIWGQSPTMKTARALQKKMTAQLHVDILSEISHGCPDIDAMARHLAPLLKERVVALGGGGGGGGASSGGGSSNADAVAFIIPYRARPVELRKWLRWMVPTLLRKGAPQFHIFVAELGPGLLWNKARLNNAAVREIRKLSSRFGCVIFADVDLVLQATAADLADGACELMCDAQLPVHYATSLIGYNAPYDVGIVPGVFCNAADGCTGPPAFHGGQSSGGVVGLTMEQFENVNGWPNSVWGWGKEDGLFDIRIKGKYGKMKAPIEWGALAGNEECIWVHMQDEETKMKGANAVDTKSVESMFTANLDSTKKDKRVYQQGYRQVDALYRLLSTDHFPLYTRFLLHLEGDR